MVTPIGGPRPGDDSLGKEDTTTPKPPSPATQQQTEDYIWNTLLPWLVAHQSSFPNYSKIVASLEHLRTEASATTDSTELEKICQEAYQECGGKGPPSPPWKKQAQEDINKAQQAYQELLAELNDLTGSITGLTNQEAALEKRLGNDQAWIRTHGQANDPKVIQDEQNCEKTLNAIKSKLTSLKAAYSTIKKEEQEAENAYDEMKNIFSSMKDGSKLSQLNNLLSQIQNWEQQGSATDADAKNAVKSLNTLMSQLTSELSQLEKDAGMKPPSPPVTRHGQVTYLDLGSIPIWDFMNWQVTPPQLNVTKFLKYVNSILDQLHAAGVNKIDISFGQMRDLKTILEALKNPGSVKNLKPEADDPIEQWAVQYPGALQQLFNAIHKHGMQVDLSIGGGDASAADFASIGLNPTQAADDLVDLMNQLHINSVDFDIETAGSDGSLEWIKEHPQAAQTFFGTLHSKLNAEGKTSTLTALGSIADDVGVPKGEGFLRCLFLENGKSVFTKYFDGLNLMLYGGGGKWAKYYLDTTKNPNDPGYGWSIERWIDILGKKNADLLHIGFQDNTDYENPNASAGQKYNINTKNRGEAAAEIYMQMMQQLKKDGYPTDLGKPFWWPSRSLDNKDRYTPGKDGTINFHTGTMDSFYQYLKEHGIST